MTDLKTIAAAEAVLDVASGVLIAAGEALAKHGGDPNAIPILAAGLALAIREVGKRDPLFLATVREMLSQ